MENTEQEKIDNTDKETQNRFFGKKLFRIKFFAIFIATLLFFYSVFIFLLSMPLKTEDLVCKYQGKFDKITCTQTGDIVPEWLQIEDNQFLKYLGIANNYTMKLILSHDSKEYKALEMTDKIFVTGLNRKFIYEIKEQTFSDWLAFKQYSIFGDCKTSNWGSVILYCSDNNLKDDICKKLKKQYRK